MWKYLNAEKLLKEEKANAGIKIPRPDYMNKKQWTRIFLETERLFVCVDGNTVSHRRISEILLVYLIEGPRNFDKFDGNIESLFYIVDKSVRHARGFRNSSRGYTSNMDIYQMQELF